MHNLNVSGTAANVWAANYAPFGATTPTGTITQNNRFPSQYADVESELSHNGFRDYAPTLGRYMQSDPIGLNGGMNTYLPEEVSCWTLQKESPLSAANKA